MTYGSPQDKPLPRRSVSNAEKDNLVCLQHSIFADVFNRSTHQVDGRFVMSQLHSLLHEGKSETFAEPPSPWELDKLQRELTAKLEDLEPVGFIVALRKLREIARRARSQKLSAIAGEVGRHFDSAGLLRQSVPLR